MGIGPEPANDDCSSGYDRARAFGRLGVLAEAKGAHRTGGIDRLDHHASIDDADIPICRAGNRR